MITFTERQIITFAEYIIANKRKFVSDADLRNHFGPYYNCIKESRKLKLQKLKNLQM